MSSRLSDAVEGLLPASQGSQVRTEQEQHLHAGAPISCRTDPTSSSDTSSTTTGRPTSSRSTNLTPSPVLLVEAEAAQHLVRGRQRRRPAPRPSDPRSRSVRADRPGRETSRLRQRGGEDHPERDRLSVGSAPERIEPLERVTERVPVVEDESGARVSLVLRDDPGLRRDAPGDHVLHDDDVARDDRSRVALQQREELVVERERVLRHLRQARAVVPLVEGREHVDVGQDGDAAARTSPRGSCPPAGSPRSSRRSPRRPARSASSGSGRTGSLACRWRPRSPARSPTAPPPSATIASSRCASRPAS